VTTRAFIGPNGALFDWDEPLPEWLTSRIASGEITLVVPPLPPRVGAGSGRAAWAAYAAAHRITVTDTMSRDHIIQAVEELSA